MNRPLAFVSVSMLGAVVGFGIAMATLKTVPTASAGDWLAFTGAVAGVMLTIGATLFIEAYGRSRRMREGVQRLRDVVEKVARGASNMRYDTPRTFAKGSARFDASGLAHSFLRVLAQFRFVHSQVPIDDVELWLQLRDLDMAGQNAVPVLEQLQAMLDTRDLGDNPEALASRSEELAAFRKKVAGAAAAVQSSAHDVRKALKRL